jgi:hypothetical protein
LTLSFLAGMIIKLWDLLKKEGIIAHELTSSNDWSALDAKFNALCSLPEPGAVMRRLDILGVPWDEMPACLIYFTGDDHFNRSMRLKVSFSFPLDEQERRADRSPSPTGSSPRLPSQPARSLQGCK